MPKKMFVLALALICSATLASGALAADIPAAASCAVTTVAPHQVDDFLAEIMAPPAGELKVSCTDPHCVTNQDCINRPQGDPSSTCEYGMLPAPPAGCGTCYY